MTKKRLRFLARTYLLDALHGRYTDIYAVYKKPSRIKVSEYNRYLWYDVRLVPHHTRASIMEHSCQQFTVGYCSVVGITPDEYAAFFVYKTHRHKYMLRLDDDEVETVKSLCV